VSGGAFGAWRALGVVCLASTTASTGRPCASALERERARPSNQTSASGQSASTLGEHSGWPLWPHTGATSISEAIPLRWGQSTAQGLHSGLEVNGPLRSTAAPRVYDMLDVKKPPLIPISSNLPLDST
jgi:hypothetical protein